MQLHWQKLGHQYSGKRVFSSGRISLPETGLIALRGPNGCGKSTLLRILAGLMIPSEGDFFLGKVSGTANPNLLSREISYCGPHENGLFPKLSGKENLEVFSALTTLPAAELPEKLAAISRCGWLPESALRSHLQIASSGMAQAVLLARSFLKPAALVLLDEPTRFLDHERSARLLDYVAGASATRLFLVATHDDSIAGIAAGEITFQGGELAFK